MKKLLPLLTLCLHPFLPAAQDSTGYRLIFMGESSPDIARELITDIQSRHLPGKTMVFVMDENKFLLGKTRPSGREERQQKMLLQKQVESFAALGIPVFFISANTEWNNLTASWGSARKVSTGIADSVMRLSRVRACPDPVELNLAPQLAVIIFNSDWWLDPYEALPITEDCECRTRADVLARLDELRYKNQDKQLVIVSRHPFKSYGVYGNRGTFRDHVFPLTGINKNVYLPLPVIGSVYRFFRSGFVSPRNSKHPLYRDMVSGVDEILNAFPNRVHVAAHEKGLQLVEDDYVQAVSGPGAAQKISRKGKDSRFANTHPGYVIADFYSDKSLRFQFYTLKKDIENIYHYNLAYKPVADTATIFTSVVQADSVEVQVHPSYDRGGGIHRFFFGENYRKEWAAPTRLPVIRISQAAGGLRPVKRGGGMQSKSLRLVDREGREWVLRSVEKSPDALLPDNFRQTFARDWVDDATSAQHPFGALVVPAIAKVVNVPHATPVIGFVAPDTALGIHGRVFANTVALLEEREPLGDSDNSEKMKKNLAEDNDNKILAREFLNARMLDILLGDWDRHEDQWRWKDMTKGKTKTYLGIPRDRDQVFHVTQGLFPNLASRSYVLPTLRDFDAGIKKVKWVLFKTRFVNAYPEFQLTREEWMEQASQFKNLVTDSVLEAALRRLPASAYQLRHERLFSILRSRRDRIPDAMQEYYRFIHRIVDIQTSDKNEWIHIADTANGGLQVKIVKISKSGRIENQLMNTIYYPTLTKELRIYTNDGNDSIVVNNSSSKIKLRIIGGNDRKRFDVLSSKGKVRIYNRENESVYTGQHSKVKKYISPDSLHTSFVPVNLYNVWMPIVVIGQNLDDGFIIGAGFKYTRQEGFRKLPYAGSHQLLARYAFATGAYRIRYGGEWIQALGKADLVIDALARAPNNTINFFGRGNNTKFDKTGDFKRFYRTRFSTYQLDPAMRWRWKSSAFSAGPSLYYYRFDSDDNTGRFITHTSMIGSYDSSTVEKSKLHLGLAFQFSRDTRNNRTFPQWGSYINVRLQTYKGIGDYARSFAQLIPEIAFYKSLTRRSTIVLAERMGGVIGVGDMAFYQSAFLGGHENLLGYRQYRFAGMHSIYNNLEIRIRVADVASYIIPGQFGITGFWDIGRVWEKDDNSRKWHNGAGAGIYFAPASVIAFSFVMGYSREGWLPYFTMGMRF